MSIKGNVFIALGDKIQVCPFAFMACQKPEGLTCPLRKKARKAEDLDAFARQALSSGGCKHKGLELTEAEHMHQQRGSLSQIGM